MKLLIFIAIYIVVWALVGKIGPMNRGKEKIKEAKRRNRTIRAQLNDLIVQTADHHSPELEMPLTNKRMRIYRYKYLHPYYQKMRTYYLLARPTKYPNNHLELYYDERGRVFHTEVDATVLGPVWKLLGVVIGLLLGALFHFMFQI
ncbi:MAG: hypothetical protein K6G04_00150 [Lachnospiraceae bacterium]|nr:hypothetical protein [Lachnospiraceae bacterium]